MKISHRNSGELLEIKLGDLSWFKLLAPPTLSPSQSEAICRWIASCWDKMPGGMLSTIELPKIFTQPQGDRVCFYPGSFNPWHEGHSECVRQVIRPLVIVPDANPWKDQTTREFNFNSAVELAKKLPQDCAIYLGFLHLNEGNPTASWLPQTKWGQRYIAMGADNFVTFEKWKNLQLLTESLKGIYVIPRMLSNEELLKKKNELNEIYENLEIEILQNHAFENLASSQLKKRETP
tara:strand:- start:2931 stop:3635 length:705 start_codon:yes stop_codon:yes gene_type:complete